MKTTKDEIRGVLKFHLDTLSEMGLPVNHHEFVLSRLTDYVFALVEIATKPDEAGERNESQ